MFARIVDSLVVNASRLPPSLLRAARPILDPAVQWRLKGIARTLATECHWLEPTSWANVEKRGENVVYTNLEEIDVSTGMKKVVGVWAVNSRRKTVRQVLGVPKKYQKTGATF